MTLKLIFIGLLKKFVKNLIKPFLEPLPLLQHQVLALQAVHPDPPHLDPLGQVLPNRQGKGEVFQGVKNLVFLTYF